MEPHGFRHFRAEPGLQPDLAQLLMLVIHAMRGGIVAKVMHHMADIMQQRAPADVGHLLGPQAPTVNLATVQGWILRARRGTN